MPSAPRSPAKLSQPVAGYILDVIGLKLGLALFVGAWSLLTMAHGLATGWLSFA